MGLHLDCIAIECEQPDRLAHFWSELLGWPVLHAGPSPSVEPDDGGVHFVFLQVNEPKRAKNRLHVDLFPDDQAVEVARAESLGAKRVSIGQGDDVSWVVLADPEGNEFCILQGATGGE